MPLLKIKSNSAKSGFALLVAIIVSTTVLTIGISIIGTALKEVVLASTVRNSLAGFYSADAAVECALYWDNVRGRFGTESAFAPGSSGDIECGGIVVPVVGGVNTGFDLVGSDLTKPCSVVTITSVPVGPGEDKVTVRARGSNTCVTGNSKKVERAIEVSYSRFR